jgi:hypothetical protein
MAANKALESAQALAAMLAPAAVVLVLVHFRLSTVRIGRVGTIYALRKRCLRAPDAK